MAIQQPNQVTTNRTTLNASGINVVSGVPNSSGYDGPWYIEEQRLNIAYRRVPTAKLDDFDCSLANITYSGYIQATELACFLFAEVKGYKDWGHYSTSSWSQPQTFTIFAASADASGNAYGDLTASSWGPAGEVVTRDPFYSRVPWVGDPSGQTEFTQSCFASNAYAVKMELGTSSIGRPEYLIDNKYWAIGTNDRGFPQYSDYSEVGHIGSWAMGRILGTYNTASEFIDTSHVVDTFGWWLQSSNLYKLPAATGDPNDNMMPMKDTGVPAYRASRHSWE